MFIAPKNIPAMHAKRTPVTGSLRQRDGARLGTRRVRGAGQGPGHARELLEGGPDAAVVDRDAGGAGDAVDLGRPRDVTVAQIRSLLRSRD
jgi:hypothetical protein